MRKQREDAVHLLFVFAYGLLKKFFGSPGVPAVRSVDGEACSALRSHEAKFANTD
jgi:hypothetical protein